MHGAYRCMEWMDAWSGWMHERCVCVCVASNPFFVGFVGQGFENNTIMCKSFSCLVPFVFKCPLFLFIAACNVSCSESEFNERHLSSLGDSQKTSWAYRSQGGMLFCLS